MAPGAFTKDYIKVCALDHETLLRWIEEQSGKSFTDYCSKCDAPRPPPPPVREDGHWQKLQAAVEASLSRTEADRAARLAAAPDYPEFINVMRREFARNPDVVAAVLQRANGVCEHCKKPAPFRRRTDGQPFLEVHHRIPLSKARQGQTGQRVGPVPELPSGTPPRVRRRAVRSGRVGRF